MSDLNPLPYENPDPILAPGARSPRLNWVRRFIVEYNPFFLISALCMLAGSLALTNSMSWSPVRLQRILVLAATINLYELLLVALGLFLVVRRRGRRDGSILLILEAFFLVDVAFLNAELFAIDRYVGLLANVVVFALVMVKLAAIFRVLRVDLASPAVVFIVGELFALFALPGVLKFYSIARGGTLPPMAMFIAWWLIAALGAAGFASMRRPAANRLPWFAPLVAVLGGVSLLAHAGTGQWVYDLHYWGADAAPMLALAAFVLCHFREARPIGVLCAVSALFMSASHDSRLTFDFVSTNVTPVHIASVVIYTLLAWTLMREMFVWLMTAAAALTMTALLGPSIATIRAWAERIVDAALAMIDAIRPRSQTAWGILSIALSFVFLAIGATVSLRRDEGEPAER